MVAMAVSRHLSTIKEAFTVEDNPRLCHRQTGTTIEGATSIVPMTAISSMGPLTGWASTGTTIGPTDTKHPNSQEEVITIDHILTLTPQGFVDNFSLGPRLPPTYKHFLLL